MSLSHSCCVLRSRIVIGVSFLLIAILTITYIALVENEADAAMLTPPVPTGTISANPDPIVVCDGSGLGVTTLTWTSTGTSEVQVRIGAPDGPLMAHTGPNGSQTTGKWVGNGTPFYLQNVTGGLPLTSANTLAVVAVAVRTVCGSITANPNPIQVCDGSGFGATTLSWTSTGTTEVQVRVGAPDGMLFAHTASSSSSTTGKWVGHGAPFYLQNVTGGLPLTAANTISVVTVNHTSSGCREVARVDPANRTGEPGEDPYSGNYNWVRGLVTLPGRAGLDLNLALAYNSRVWTRSLSNMTFDDDRGFPTPGFRLGFPVIQHAYFNSQTGKSAYLLITPEGRRVELRQVGSSTRYEAADSSYVSFDQSSLILRATDGTQLQYAWQGADYQCTQIKDRNGNYITINYAGGQIATVVDTLGRTLTFNYTDGRPTSITQDWGGTTHNWARFFYADLTISANFQGLTMIGTPNGATGKVLKEVRFSDESRVVFNYTSWGQVWKIEERVPDGDLTKLINYRSYNLPQNNSTPQTDCPRFTERRDWAENWNRGGTEGLAKLPTGAEQEAVTTFNLTATSWTLPDQTQQTGVVAQITRPDQTYDKLYYPGVAGTATGWHRGLPTMIETYLSNNNDPQRQSVTTWTQDSTNITYPLNPRVQETNVYDSNNRARTQISYKSFSLDGTTIHLPEYVREYQANASTVLRSTHTQYNLDTTYTARRIIGLVSEKLLYEGDIGATLMSRVGYEYDEEGSIEGSDAPVQHDNTGPVAGRANLSSVKRYNVTNSAFTWSRLKYNTAGAVTSSIDPRDHETK